MSDDGHSASMYYRHYFHSHRHSLRIVAYLTLAFLVLCGLYSTAVQQSGSTVRYPFDSPYVDDVPLVDVDWNARREQVKDAFRHAYHAYEAYAAPADELAPISKTKSDPFNGWGVTIFDSLDTMLLMGLDDEFRRALKFVESANFTMREDRATPYFETVIRYLGGMLSAYALSGEELLLKRADELAERLDPVFNTSSGLPAFGVNPVNGRITLLRNLGLAEIASLQMEYSYLAHLTQKKKWQDRVDNVINTLMAANIDRTGGMLPTRWDIATGQPVDDGVSVGGQADSAHEYLLKQHLLTARTDKDSLQLYLQTTTHIIDRLLYLSPNRQLLYVTDTRKSSLEGKDWPTHKFEHLSCFLPGLLALGAHSLPLDSYASTLRDIASSHDYGKARDGYIELAGYNSLKEMHMIAAEGLAMSCWLSYADQPTGLGPEIMLMKGSQENPPVRWLDMMGKWYRSGRKGLPPGLSARKPVRKQDADYDITEKGYLLRPETIESMYILWKVTGDVKWRQRGWLVFQAIERHTRMEAGYAILKSVITAETLDEMPSFFLAETLKYLYLLFDDEDQLPLDKWVFNTEAHPFPVFSPTVT